MVVNHHHHVMKTTESSLKFIEVRAKIPKAGAAPWGSHRGGKHVTGYLNQPDDPAGYQV